MRILGGVLICWAFLAMLLLNSGCSSAPQLSTKQRVELGVLAVRVACAECTDATCGRDVVETCRQLFPVEVRVPPEPGLDTMPRSGDSGPPHANDGSGSEKGAQRSEADTASDVKGGASGVSSPSLAPPVSAPQYEPGPGNGVRSIGGAQGQ